MPKHAPTATAVTAYSPDDLARQWGVTRTHIYNEIRRGNLPAFKVGRAVRIPADAVNELMGGGEGD